MQRYQWEKPGDMIHVDTKQLARFERVCPTTIWLRGAGYEKVHVAIDDATRWPMSRCFRTSRRQRLSASWLGLSAGSASRASPAGASSRTTGLLIDQESGARPARPSISERSAQSRTSPSLTARPSGMASGGLRLYPDPLPGMGLWPALPDLRGVEAVASSLSEAL